jgi:hypothetical protein
MNTGSLITLIKKQAPQWARDNIRELLNEVQRMLLNTKPLSFMRVVSSTGVDPVLVTSSGIYSYEISIANGFVYDASRVVSVYNTDTKEKIDCTLIPGTPSNAAKVIFPVDPGVSSYSMMVYRKATEILVEATPIDVPAEYHISILMEGVLGLIEKMDHGGVSQRWEKFETVLVPRLYTNLNAQVYNTVLYTPLKGY